MSGKGIERLVVVGAGGVGGCIGALLSEQLPVLLVARGAHLDHIQGTGLEFQTPRARRCLDLPATDRPDWRDGDVALLAVKSQDTAAALQRIPPEVPVVCAQNGVENEELAARSNATIGMMVWMLASHLSPGIVALYSRDCPGVLDLGALDSDQHRAHQLAEILRSAGFDSVVRPDIMEWKRAKLLSNLPGVFQLSDSPLDPGQADALIEEGKEVLRRARLPHTDSGRFLARVRGIEHSPIGGVERPGGSLWQSRFRKSGSELDHLNGYIVRLARRLGIPTPVHDQVLALVRPRYCGALSETGD